MNSQNETYNLASDADQINSEDHQQSVNQSLHSTVNQSLHPDKPGDGGFTNRAVFIGISEVIVGNRLRSAVSTKVDELAESINAVGLLQPIVITEEKHLVAGLHRLRACQQLGFNEIHAVVIPDQQLKKEIAEIDENLIRNSLTVLEQCEQLKRRKELYEVLYPETRRGGYVRPNQNEELQSNDINDNRVVSEPFSSRAADEKRVTPRTIQRAVRIAERLDETVKNKIADLPVAARFTQLMRLAELEPVRQREIVDKMREEKLSFSQALNSFKTGETEANSNDVSEPITGAQRKIKKWTLSLSSVLNQFEDFNPSELQIVIEQLRLDCIDISIVHRLLAVCSEKPTPPNLPDYSQRPVSTARESLSSGESENDRSESIATLPLFQLADIKEEHKI